MLGTTLTWRRIGLWAANAWWTVQSVFLTVTDYSPLLIRLVTSVTRKCLIQGRFGHGVIRAPIASKVIQNIRLCVMIFPDSWLARFTCVTPQISPDNTLRHSVWSHSPDLAAPANAGAEWEKTVCVLCLSHLLKEKRFSSTNPADS